MSDETGCVVTKRGRVFINGPLEISGGWGMDVQPFDGYKNLEDIVAVFDSISIPDFHDQHAKVSAISVIIEDDPVDIGFAEMKRLISSVAECYRLLSSYRSEVIGIRAEWSSLKTAFEVFLAAEKQVITNHPDFSACKNADQRQAFVLDKLSDYNLISIGVAQAMQRCTDFIELCRIKGKELDKCMIALNSQIDIIKLQVKLGFIQPVHIEE